MCNRYKDKELFPYQFIGYPKEELFVDCTTSGLCLSYQENPQGNLFISSAPSSVIRIKCSKRTPMPLFSPE